MATSSPVTSLPRCAILDGGLGSELDSLKISGDPLWSARILSTNVNAIKAVHRRFLEAGADIIETATYQASIEGFKKHLGLDEEAAKLLIMKGVDIAREVRDAFWTDHPELHTVRCRPLVAGSVGPYGACQADGSEYTGTYVDSITGQELLRWHRPRIKALLAAGVDLLAIDTIPAQIEAEVLMELLKEFPACRAWLSFSCKDGAHTVHGERLSEAVRAIVHSEQLIGVGINCLAPKYVEPLLTALQPVIGDKIMVVYPNSGETWSDEKRWVGGDRCPKLHDFTALWWSLGARWLGGCCRILPEDIALIRQAVDKIDPAALRP